MPKLVSRAQEILQPTVFLTTPPPSTLQNSPFLCSSVSVIALNQEGTASNPNNETFSIASRPSKILGAVNGEAFQTRSERGLEANSGQMELNMQIRSAWNAYIGAVGQALEWAARSPNVSTGTTEVRPVLPPPAQ